MTHVGNLYLIAMEHFTDSRAHEESGDLESHGSTRLLVKLGSVNVFFSVLTCRAESLHMAYTIRYDGLIK